MADSRSLVSRFCRLMQPKCFSSSSSFPRTGVHPLRNSALSMVFDQVSNSYKQGNAEHALDLLQLASKEDVTMVSEVYVQLLQQCGKTKHFLDGKTIHEHVVGFGLESDLQVANSLLGMYLRCEDLQNARRFFDEMLSRDVISWNLMIQGYAKGGCADAALRLWEVLKQQEGLKPSRVSFLLALNSCAMLSCLETGKQVHADAMRAGFVSDIFVATALVDMYGKCGSLLHACQVFDRMPKRNVVSWTALIAGYVRAGRSEEAISLFTQMKQEGLKPNRVTFVVALNACAHIRALKEGRQIHNEAIEAALDSDLKVCNALVDMYAKCESLIHARRLFDGMSKRDSVSWNSLIAGYAKQGKCEEALELSHQMQQHGLKFTGATFVCLLTACANLSLLEFGKKVHADIRKAGLESNVFVGAALIDMYAKCGALVHAREVFDGMPKGDVVSWTAMIAGYAIHGNARETFLLFSQMQEQGFKPNQITLVNIFSLCTHLGLLEEGCKFHDLMTQEHDMAPTKTQCMHG